MLAAGSEADDRHHSGGEAEQERGQAHRPHQKEAHDGALEQGMDGRSLGPAVPEGVDPLGHFPLRPSEWGNPNEKEYYDYMRSYSPYDNVKAQDYPNMYVSTGLHDSQVQYWEPAKWVAKLRVMKTNQKQLFLDTNMDAGHGGASGRFEALKELAKEFAFLLDLEKIQR